MATPFLAIIWKEGWRAHYHWHCIIPNKIFTFSQFLASITCSQSLLPPSLFENYANLNIAATYYIV